MVKQLNKVLAAGTLMAAGVAAVTTQTAPTKADTYNAKIATINAQTSTINLYNNQGQVIPNRQLPANTQWRVGKIAYFQGGSQNLQNVLMYQVAPNEWLRAQDSSLNVTPTNVVTKNLDTGITTPVNQTPVTSAANATTNPATTAAPVNNSDLVTTAKSMLGYFNYGATHGISNIGSVANPNPNGVTDCSGFVWLALAKAGYRVPANMGWYTQTMENDAKGAHQYLQAIDPSQAQAGDIVIVNTNDGFGQNGHTAILEGPWQNVTPGSNMTPVIQMGGRTTAKGVNEDGFATSFLSLLQGNYTLTIARPIR